MNDEVLTLYYYNDGLSADERQRACDAIAGDQTIAERYRQLCAELESIPTERGETLAPDRMSRFHDTISRAARLDAGKTIADRPRFSFTSFFWGAAVTAALATGIAIGVLFTGTSLPPPADLRVDVRDNPVPRATSALLSRSLQAHFRDSRDGLASLPVDSQPERMAIILQMIAQNRLYEKVAVQNDAPKLARVLRAFEPILVRLAAEDLAPADAEALRAQLAFELNVMLTKLARESSDESHST